MAQDSWFTLVRFKDDPMHLRGVSQARTAQEALDQLTRWERQYPDNTKVVFDRDNRPIVRQTLAHQVADVDAATRPSEPAR